MDPAVTFLLGGLGCVLALLGARGWWGTWRTWALTRKRWSGWAPLMLLAMGAGLVLLAVGFEVMYASFPPIPPLATATFAGASVLFIAAVVFLFFGAPYALLPRWIRRRVDAAIVFSDGAWGLGSFFLLVGVVAAAVASFVVRGALSDGWVMVGPEGISLGKVRLRWEQIAGGRGRRAV